jgi:archaemetzincin
MKNLVQILVILGFVYITFHYNNSEKNFISDVVTKNNDNPYAKLQKVVYKVRGLGDVSNYTLNDVASTIESFYGFTTIVENNVDINSNMYIKNTDEILNASVCLENLNSYTTKTIYVTNKELWALGRYVNGLAYYEGNSVIVSTKATDITETVKHEVGHTLGLNHCIEKTCVMASENDYFETGKFCTKCKNHLINRFNIQKK